MMDAIINIKIKLYVNFLGIGGSMNVTFTS